MNLLKQILKKDPDLFKWEGDHEIPESWKEKGTDTLLNWRREDHPPDHIMLDNLKD